MSRRGFIEFDLWPGEVALEDMWPDGDMPENPTADDVAQLVREQGGLRWALSDWNLLSGCTIRVTVDGVTTKRDVT